MNIIVTGGAGFIGRRLIILLLLQTKYKILNVDKISYASDIKYLNKMIQNHNEIEPNRYSHVQIDLANKLKVDELVNNFKPDIVFHLAAESHVDNSINSSDIFISSNINGTFNLIESLRIYWKSLNKESSHKLRFIHVSTDEVFGSINYPFKFNEESKYDPKNPYSASKAASDHLVKSWFNTYNFPAIITNCSNNYGPGQSLEKMIPKVITNALHNKIIPIYGDGSNVRDWIHVDDHVNALLSILDNGILGESYCIGTSSEWQNKNLVEYICKELDFLVPKNKKYSTLINYVLDRPGHDFRYATDSSKLKNNIGWLPEISFKQGIRETIQWYIENSK